MRRWLAAFLRTSSPPSITPCSAFRSSRKPAGWPCCTGVLPIPLRQNLLLHSRSPPHEHRAALTLHERQTTITSASLVSGDRVAPRSASADPAPSPLSRP